MTNRRGTTALLVRIISIAGSIVTEFVAAGGVSPTFAARVTTVAAVCPEAPPGMQGFANDVTAWVKWGVLVLIGISAVVSLGAVLAGRIFSHPHASRYGAMGVAVTVLVAITYTVILVILDSITGSGCT